MEKIIGLACIFFAATLFSLSAHSADLDNQEQLDECSFSKKGHWWTTPYDDLANNVANNKATGEPEFCEFYQFAQDWFLYLISPSSIAGQANWEDQLQYPLLETSGTNSCDDEYPAHAMNIRTAKSPDDSKPFVLPERIDQAFANAIYDQNGNVVFYEIRFSKNLCDYPAIQSKPNFPGKTVELKMAWKVLTPREASANATSKNYYPTTAVIDGTSYNLGLIGWHIVVAADNHPEMVWITLDHRANAIDCDVVDFNKYNFTSNSCATAPNKGSSKCTNLNETTNSTSLTTKTPNDICLEYPYGTGSGDIATNNGLNIALIKKLNSELQGTIFKPKNLPDSISGSWINYRFTGALWLSKISENSNYKGRDNQRGSLELANGVMETSFQGNKKSDTQATNCFSCHQYTGTATTNYNNTATSAILSRIFDDIISSQQCNDIQARTLINSQSQADNTCPTTCTSSDSNLVWNGQWTNQDASTGAQLPASVCGCCIKK